MKKLLISLALLFAAICPAQEDYVRDGSPQPGITWTLGNRPILSILSGANGVDQLDPNLTINGTTVTPMFRYKGGDADGTDWDVWGYGATLPLQAGTVPTYNQGSPLLGTNDDSVKFNAGGYYKDSGSTTGDVETEDLVFELVIKTTDGSALEYSIAKRGVTGASEGWGIYNSTGNTIVLFFDSGTPQAAIGTNTLSPNVWHHVLFFVNRDEASTDGAKVYVNGALSGSANLSTVSASLTNTNNLIIGANQDGVSQYTANVAFLAGYKHASWHQAGAAGPTEWAAIAKDRFLKLTGFYSPKGTVTYSRPTEAVLSKYEGSATKLYTVGDGWPRLDYVVDSASDEIRGYRAETEDENELLYSEEFDDATWVKTRTTVDSDALLAPNKELTADGLVGDAVSNTHYIEQALASSAAEHIFAVYAKAGDEDWLYLAIPTVANANAYYDLSTCSTGTVGAGAVAYVEDLGDGWCRTIIVYTGGAPSHAHRIYSAEADTDHTFTGDGTTVNTWLWGATHSDEGLGYPTSYIKTEGSLVTRVKDDDLLTMIAALTGKGRMTANILLPDYDSAQRQITYLSDGGSANESISLFVHNTSDVLNGTIIEGGVTRYDDGGTTDLSDGVIHGVAIKYSIGSASLKVDGAVEDTGTPAATPDDLDQLEIGQTNAAASQLNGVIGQIKIYKR